jgi:putative endopeptidase
MSDETKVKALDKLAKFNPKIGYPNKWRDYSALKIGDDLHTNLQNIAKFERDYQLDKLGGPIDRDEWAMTPQTVNAYYNPGYNEIVFPAAILQPPFFNPDADDAENYGSIGAIIGHEIGHGFDDQGSRYDGDGNLSNWWSEQDRAEFEKRTGALVDQYNQLSPSAAPEVKVNGTFTLGENIGDLGGMNIAIKAYYLSLDGNEALVIDGFTPMQRFFLSWAQSWRRLVRPDEARLRIATDPHSPDEHRCNQIIRNLDEFYEAFEVTESDALYLKDRVKIW